MARQFEGATLVIATHNPGKLREIADLLAPYGVEAASPATLGLPETAETGRTFAENARAKAEAAARASRLPALADDSGLAVDALGGAPGVESARFAGPKRDFTEAMRRIEDEVRGSASPSGRHTHFVCALALSWPDGHTELFEGRVDGRLVWPPRGTRGFGYDPVFLPDDRQETFGEMEPQAKHAISHRADAFRRLVAACFAGAGE